LFFYNGVESRIMVVHYSTKNGVFAVEKPRVWSDLALVALNASVGAPGYDLAPDGKRIAAVAYAGGSPQQDSGRIIFLENFFDELQRKVPLK
jgi:hypothetical protein